MRTFLAAVAMCLIALPVQAGFKVCNKTAHEAKVAMGLFDGTVWTSRGWWRIAPEACREILEGPLYARYYYLYASDGGSGGWDGKKGFCVVPGGTFEIKGRRNCEGHGFDRKGFFEIDTGQARDYTQTLSE